MNRLKLIGIIVLLLTIVVVFLIRFLNTQAHEKPTTEILPDSFPDASGWKTKPDDIAMKLPTPVTIGLISLEEALTLRRSVRHYTERALSLIHLSQLLWSGQGITNAKGFRTAPSAGATFPLELYVLANRVEGLDKGLYHYLPHGHSIKIIHQKEIINELVRACLSQSMVGEAAAVLVIAADFERTTNRYGERGIRYVYNEVGHASQNMHLQVASLGLGTVVIGAFNDEEVENLLGLPPGVRILYLMPVGHSR